MRVLFSPTVPWTDLRQTPQQLALKFEEHGWTVYYGERGKLKHWNVQQVAPQTDIWRIGRFSQYAKRLGMNGGVDLKIVGDPASCPDSFWRVPSRHTLFLLWDAFEDWKPFEEVARQQSTIVATTSHALADVRKTGEKWVLPNAAPAELLQKETQQPYLYSKLDRTKNLVLFFGYVGDWVDTELLEEVGKENTLVLAGRNNRAIPPIQNCIHVGQLSYEAQLPFIAHADATIIPFKEDCETAWCASPLKMYESLALGTPVVSRGNFQARQMTNVYCEEDSSLFNAAIKSAIAWVSREKCRLEAAEHTWDHRFRKIMEWIA